MTIGLAEYLSSNRPITRAAAAPITNFAVASAVACCRFQPNSSMAPGSR